MIPTAANSLPQEPVTREVVKNDYISWFLVIATVIEIIIYTIFYLANFFGEANSYIPGTYYPSSIVYLFSRIILFVLSGISVYLLAVKAALVFRNIYGKRHIKSSLLALLITFSGPIIFSSLAIFYYQIIHIFITDISGRNIVSFNSSALKFGFVPFVLFATLYFVYTIRDKAVYGNVKLGPVKWLGMIASASIVIMAAGIFSNVQSQLEEKNFTELATIAEEKGRNEGIESIAPNPQSIGQVIIKPTRIIASKDGFQFTLFWDRATSKLPDERNLLVQYSDDNSLISNPYGDVMYNTTNGSCTLVISGKDNYYCHVSFTNSIWDSKENIKPGNYSVYLDNDTKYINTANQRDEMRIEVLKKLSQEFEEYYREFGVYPQNRKYIGPLPDEYYYAQMNDYSSGKPSYIALAKLETSKNQNRLLEYFCVDSKRNAKIITQKPSLDILNYEYGCDIIEPNYEDQGL